MANNETQVCILGVFFPCPNNSRATDVKDKIEELLVDVPEAKVELTLRSGGSRDVQSQRVPSSVS